MLQDAEPGQGKEYLAEHRQWQMAGVGCTEEKAQAPEHLKDLSGQGKLTGSMVIIQQSQ